MYGHIEAMARSFKEGVDSVDGAEGVLLRVPETLSDDGETCDVALTLRAIQLRGVNGARSLHPPRLLFKLSSHFVMRSARCNARAAGE